MSGFVFKPSQHRFVKELAALVGSQRSACPAFDVVCVYAALARVVDYDDLLDAPRFPVEIECTAFVQLAASVCLEVVPPSVSHVLRLTHADVIERPTREVLSIFRQVAASATFAPGRVQMLPSAPPLPLKHPLRARSAPLLPRLRCRVPPPPPLPLPPSDWLAPSCSPVASAPPLRMHGHAQLMHTCTPSLACMSSTA